MQEQDEGILLAANPEEANSVFSALTGNPLFENIIPFNSAIKNLLDEIPIEQTKIESEGELSKDYYRMWEGKQKNKHLFLFL